MFRKSNFKLNWKYAMGELVLIFLGISLAIAFQNWNEERKNRIELQSILSNLETELKEDSASYELTFQRLVFREKNISQLQEYFRNQPKQIDSARTSLSIITAGFITTYYPGFAVYSELLGSGKLSLVKSEEIKKALASYQSNVSIGQSLDAIYHTYSKELEKNLVSYLSVAPDIVGYDTIPPASFAQIRFDLSKMSRDKELMNDLKYTKYYTKIERTYKQNAVMPSLDSLLLLIRNELKK